MKEQLAKVIRKYHKKGWSQATSTNYSFKDENQQIWVSRSGVDKSEFSEKDFIQIDENGIPLEPNVKPSAETLIHCVIYNLFKETKVILHSHSVYPILISANVENELCFSGYEMQKGFEGQTTHDDTVHIPVFENTQNMHDFSATLLQNAENIKNHCFIIKKHGTYAWGKNLFEAKRHLETLDYLSQCEWMMKEK